MKGVQWPGKAPAGTTSNAISMNFDVLAKLAGADLPNDRAIDGKDIWSLLQGGEASPHDYLYLFNDAEIVAWVQSN